MGRERVVEEKPRSDLKVPPGVYGECERCGLPFGVEGIQITEENVRMGKVIPFDANKSLEGMPDLCEICEAESG